MYIMASYLFLLICYTLYNAVPRWTILCVNSYSLGQTTTQESKLLLLLKIHILFYNLEDWLKR